VLLTVLGCVDLVISSSVLSIEGFLAQGLESLSKCDKFPEYLGESGGSM
jgi:hypothetical protein